LLKRALSFSTMPSASADRRGIGKERGERGGREKKSLLPANRGYRREARGDGGKNGGGKKKKKEALNSRRSTGRPSTPVPHRRGAPRARKQSKKGKGKEKRKEKRGEPDDLIRRNVDNLARFKIRDADRREGGGKKKRKKRKSLACHCSISLPAIIPFTRKQSREEKREGREKKRDSATTVQSCI